MNLIHSIKKTFVFSMNTNMLKLSLKELKLIAKTRKIKGYKTMYERRLLSILNA